MTPGNAGLPDVKPGAPARATGARTDAGAAARAESAVARAIGDIASAFRRWNVVALLGASDVASRYRRSTLGQFWITLSNAIQIVAIGVVWAQMWKMPAADFMPYFAAGYVFWILLTTTLLDASNCFANAAAYLKELNLPRSTYVFANLVKNAIVLGHNAIIIPLTLAFFGLWPGWSLLLLIPALILTFLTLAAASFWIAIAGLRFRDIPNLLGSLFAVLFFVTPVIWKIEALPADMRGYFTYNPFHIFLELLRAPWLGDVAPPSVWIAALFILVVNAALGAYAFVGWRGRITYWL